MIKKTFLLILVLNHLVIFSQNDSLKIYDHHKKNSFLKRSIVPITLIGTGLIINYSTGCIGKVNLQEKIQENLYGFHTNAENFIMFIPTITMYTADIFKVESKNDAFTQTKYLVIAGLTNSLITYGLKRITDEERPNGEDYSFPSGHTSNAFVMATVLHHEFVDTSPWLAYSGFLFATTTGILRVLNNKHWVSDVLVGAGLGMIVTDLVYRFEPLKNWNPFNNKKTQVIFSPTFSNEKIGLYANVQF